MSALVATNQAVAVSNLVSQTTGLTLPVTDIDDPVEKQFKSLEAADDAAQAEVGGWIHDNDEFKAKGAGIPDAELNRRIMKRLTIVRQGYEDFLKDHPNHVKARVAFASFLDDIHDEDAEMEQLEKAHELDPKDAAVWNNMANYYGHNSPVKKAFEYYEKAIELDTNVNSTPTSLCICKISPRPFTCFAKTPGNIITSRSNKFLTRRLISIPGL
jgi:tetratricopeptide (TPR) repeat protein